MKLVADYHVHSRFSDGQATLLENVEAAMRRGLTSVALTDHGPRHISSGIGRDSVQDYLDQIAELKRVYGTRIAIKTGIEANPIDLSGGIDVPKEHKDAFEVVGVGFHRTALGSDFRTNAFFQITRHTMPRESRKARMTDLLIAVMEHNRISFLAHPGQYVGELDWVRLAKACAAHCVAIEINAHAGHLLFSPEDAAAMREQGAVFVVNSDAHRPQEIGNFQTVQEFLARATLSVCDIVNAEGYNAKRPMGL